MPLHRRLSASPFTSPLRLSIGLPGFVSAALLAPSARAQPSADLPEEHAEPDAPPSIGLADAVSEALARNPTAQVAYDELERARAIVEETRANALPTLYGNATYTRLDATRVFNGVVYAAADQLGANALLTVPIIAPRPWAQWSQAKDSVEAARASAVDTRRLVAVAVARAYLAVVAQKRVIEAVVRARDTDRAHYAYAHQRYGGGIGNRIDEVRAEQQLQSDEAIVEQQKVALARDREALGVLVGVGGPLDADEPNLHGAGRRRTGDGSGRAPQRRARLRGPAARCSARGARQLDGLFALPHRNVPAVLPEPSDGHPADNGMAGDTRPDAASLRRRPAVRAGEGAGESPGRGQGKPRRDTAPGAVRREDGVRRGRNEQM